MLPKVQVAMDGARGKSKVTMSYVCVFAFASRPRMPKSNAMSELACWCGEGVVTVRATNVVVSPSDRDVELV